MNKKIFHIESKDVKASYYSEPLLKFGNGGLNADPKTGLPLFGPYTIGTSRHKSEIHIGIIGTSRGIELVRNFFEESTFGIDGNSKNYPFPGCNSEVGFKTRLIFDDNSNELITRKEIKKIEECTKKKDKFETLVAILSLKLHLISTKDQPIDYLIITVPHNLFVKLHTVEYYERGVGKIHRNLRRVIKAIAMRYRLVSQIIIESTFSGEGRRQVDDITRIAWNLYTGLYFKVGGLPWVPSDLPPASCYIGISFYQPMFEVGNYRTSIAQAFDEHGEGLVLRGHKFEWDDEEFGNTPHLNAEQALELIQLILEKYKAERKQYPKRVIVQKSTHFTMEEKIGFENALENIEQYDLLTLNPTSKIRLLRAGNYPTLRGAKFSIANNHYIYTTGFLYPLNIYPHGHVPSPLQITDHIGDTSIDNLIKEVMILTKINWNSANFAGLLPINMRFSRLVGEIMREIPEHEEPLPQYKYYM